MQWHAIVQHSHVYISLSNEPVGLLNGSQDASFFKKKIVLFLMCYCKAYWFSCLNLWDKNVLIYILLS